MSVQCMGAVIDCGPQDGTQFRVMIVLANTADDFGFTCPSIATLAAGSRCSPRQAMRTLAELEARGWLFVARRVLNGKSNIYVLNLAKMGVTVSPNARRSPLFSRLLKTSGDKLAPIFLSENSGDTARFSGDNPQAPQVTQTPTQVTNEGGSGDKAWHPNRYEPLEQNRKGTVNEVEPPPLPPRGGEKKTGSTLGKTLGAEIGALRREFGLEPEPDVPAVKGAEGVAEPAPESGEALDLPAVPAAQPAPLFEPGPALRETWTRMKTALKADLERLPPSIEKRFTTLATEPGESDYDVCFRDWWLEGTRRERGVFCVVTAARDPAMTQAGVDKYAARLARIARLFLRMGEREQVRFEVQPEQPVGGERAA